MHQARDLPSVLNGPDRSSPQSGCSAWARATTAEPTPAPGSNHLRFIAGVLHDGHHTGAVIVHGMAAGQLPATHPDIVAVAFTGSTRGGRALFDLTAGRAGPIPFFGEHGSLNPLAVTPAAAAAGRAAQIGEGWAESLALGAGQFCTKPGLALVPAGADGDILRDAAAEKARPMGPAWMLNQAIHDACKSGVAQLAPAV